MSLNTPGQDHKPEAGHPRPHLTSRFVAPKSNVEQAVAEIWQGLLGIEQIGVHDNFFEVGGHSLLATQVMTRIRIVFQVELPLRAFFEADDGITPGVTQWARVPPTSVQTGVGLKP